MTNKKKPEILLVGAGLTALAVARQLDKFSIIYDWIGPALSLNQLGAIHEDGSGTSVNLSLSYSPKLSRSDYLLDQRACARLLGCVKARNFLLSRSVRHGGLGNYWGANTAKSFVTSLSDSEVDADDMKLMESLLPTISIDQDPNIQTSAKQSIKHFIASLQRASDSLGMCGSVYTSDLALTMFPGIGEDFINYNAHIVGNLSEIASPPSLMNGVVVRIQKSSDGYQTHIKLQDVSQAISNSYKTLVLCGGSLENLRLLAGMEPNLLAQAFSLQHHPILTGFLFSFALPSALMNWPLSCFDLHIAKLLPSTLAEECYINMIPALPALKVAFKKDRVVSRLISIPFIESIVSRLFVVNVYLSSSLSASYVRAVQEGSSAVSLEVFGNYHPTLFSLVPAIRRRLRSFYRRSGLWLFSLRLLPPGTDQHLSSSLSDLCEPSSALRPCSFPAHGSLLVPDASSVLQMPICNPTYALALRAIGLVRSAITGGLIRAPGAEETGR
jgi:hypothetical protein